MIQSQTELEEKITKLNEKVRKLSQELYWEQEKNRKLFFRNQSLTREKRKLEAQKNTLEWRLESNKFTDTSLQGVIKKTIDEYFGLSIDYKTRQRQTVSARMIYYRVMRDKTNMSLNEISATIAFKPNHATIIHSLQLHEDLLMFDKQYTKDYETLVSIIDGEIKKRVDNVD